MNGNLTTFPVETFGLMSDCIFVKWKNQFRKLRLERILWIEADGNYSVIVTDKRKYAPTVQLRHLNNRLQCPFLVRVHRSYVVNIHHITHFEEHRLFINEQAIPISKSYRAEFFKLFRMIG